MAEKKGTPLSGVAGFPAEVAEKLAKYWITTAEELAGAAVQPGGLAGLVNVTGQSETETTRLVELAQAALPAGVSFAPGDVQVFGLGAMDEREPGEERQVPPSFAPLPPAVDLRPRFGPIRNQANRGTCVSFASTAVREFLLGGASPQGDYAEQFLYWACKQHDGYPGSGTYIKTAMQRLEMDGVCTEPVWPYNPNNIPGNEGQDPPPPGAVEKARLHRITGWTRLTPTAVDGLRQVLSENKPVAFAVPVYTSWFMEPTRSSGDIRLPLPGENIEGGHAMCLVGYETDGETPGGGYFLVRNSWGTTWASSSQAGPGYARMPFAYINQYCNSAFTAELNGVIPEPEKSFWERLLEWLRSIFK